MGALKATALLLAATVIAGCGGSPVASQSTPRPFHTATPTETPRPTPATTSAPAWAPKFDETPVAAQTAAELAQQFVIVEKAIRDPNVTGAQLKWFGHLEQLIFGRLNDYPDWRNTVVEALPEAQRTTVRRAMEAGGELRKLHSGPAAKELPNWQIVAPSPPETLVGYYREAEAAFGVGWHYLAAINLVETRMGRIRGLSSAGAQGPMQFMPPTWAAYGAGGDVHDERDAIMGAGRYLKAAGAPGNMAKALWAYNHSDFYVNAIELYAQAIKADPMAYRGYHGWQVYYWLETGPELLYEGWKKN